MFTTLQAEYKGFSTMGQPSRGTKGKRSRDWLTTAEAAEAAQVSQPTIQRWCKSRPGFARQVGKIWRVSPAALRSLLGDDTKASEGSSNDRPEGTTTNPEQQFDLF